MSIEIGIGFSQATNMETAAREAVVEAKRQLRQDRIDLTIVLSTIQYDPRVTLPIFRSLLGGSKIIGTSTAGIILPNQVETRGLAVLTIHTDDVRFGIGVTKNIIESKLNEAGTALAQDCLNDFGTGSRNLFLFFTDGQLKNNSQIIEGIQQVLGTVFPIIGAGSCDDFKFHPSFQLFEDSALTMSATGIIIGGHVSAGIGASHGWRPLGKPRFVTQSDGPIIKTINHQKASLLYQEFFGEDALKLRSTEMDKMGIIYPLGLYIEATNDYLIRNAINFLPDGSVLCQGDVPEGGEIHIMIGNKESCKDAAAKAAHEAKAALVGKKPKLIFVIESMGRLKLLGRNAKDETATIRDIFGPEVPILGLYANGEIYPFQAGESMRQSYLQNESIVILAIT